MSLLRQRGAKSAVGDSSLNVWPLTTLRRIPSTPFWTMTILEPSSATSTSVRCEVYSAKPKIDPNRYSINLAQMEEDFKSHIQALELDFSDISSNDETPMNTIISPAQHQILKQLESHTKMERKSGEEIFPAVLPVSKTSPSCGVAERRE